MTDWAAGTWIALVALGSTCILGLVGYLRSPPLVPASRIEAMTQRIDMLQKEVDDLRRHCERCEIRVSQLREDNQWLQRQLRNADDRREDARREAEAKRRDEA